ncbi:Acetyltransferase (GNAT) family protein [Gemmobacter aquatilis]|uniref:Acetyltransferase (GNAT) family protein n=1 Tax=Gemmobacter aquatilis TaxID=933059 RepID=A0A1H7ZUR3_9RHOB|nr:GNAT family N-acetyltransferase [Gemmobacter aquatilis]SEM62362.1 Acetyltransferase (GNAT) family protein [Gemmobacter aquatilis]
MIRSLDPQQDRAAVAALFRAAADYVALETGLPVDDSQADAFFTDAPPGIDPATSLRLGLFDGATLLGKVDVAFGYPGPQDAYIGLMIFAPAARGAGHGARLLRAVETAARARGATRLLIAALEANPKGRAFWQREGFLPEQVFPDRPYGTRHHTVHRMAKPL